MGKDARVPGERDLTLLSPLYPNNLTSVPDGSAFARPRGPHIRSPGLGGVLVIEFGDRPLASCVITQ